MNAMAESKHDSDYNNSDRNNVVQLPVSMSGYFEFQKHGLIDVGDPDYDKTIIFPIFNTVLNGKREIVDEMKEISRITGVQYANVDKKLDEIYQAVNSSVQRDIAGFDKRQLRYFVESRYIADKTPAGIALFSLKLNKDPIGKAFRGYDNLTDFANITLDAKYFDYPENVRSNASNSKPTRERFSSATATQLRSMFSKQFGVDIARTPLLHSENANELFAVARIDNRKVKFFGVNLKTGKALESFVLDEFKY